MIATANHVHHRNTWGEAMVGVITFFIVVGILLLLGMLFFILELLRPRAYPPKRILQARAKTLGGAGFLFCFFGIILAILTK
ncbi:hypothetical protein [Lederbergia graminis]|uniref:Uncharacterized protein n=1 Tax=Lederbergia graminis TaxID=735518 RepID=A0ABW0LIF6_9BACI